MPMPLSRNCYLSHANFLYKVIRDIITNNPHNMELSNIALVFLGIIVFLLSLLIYFIPAIRATRTKHAFAIFILNLFLGWTFLGWLAALIWALALPRERLSEEREYYCGKCNYKKIITQPVTMFKCQNCGEDNDII